MWLPLWVLEVSAGAAIGILLDRIYTRWENKRKTDKV